MIPVARRVLGENQDTTLRMRTLHSAAIYLDTDATLNDLRKAVTTLEDLARIVRQVFGGAHPMTVQIEDHLRASRAALGSA